MNYKEAVEYIENIPKFTKKHKREHTQKAMQYLSCDSIPFGIIHVAGTNGKGSVCAYISSVLTESGKKVGLFTSPHLIDIRERFVIGNKKVGRQTFLDSFLKVLALSKKMEEAGDGHPSYFEFLFLMALDIFRKEKVEYAVLETGLGGRLDATNSIKSPLLTVITSIGLDHTEILGDSLEKIAGEKAGIIKANIPLVYLQKQKEVTEVIEERAKAVESKTYGVSAKNYGILCRGREGIDFLYKGEEQIRARLPFVADYQAENAAIAIRSLLLLRKIDLDLKNCLSCGTIKRGIENTSWQGRMEIVEEGLILDGAHNEDGIDCFLSAVKELCHKQSPHLLFSSVMEKDYRKMIEKICKALPWQTVTVTSVGGWRSISAKDLAGLFKENGCREVFYKENVGEAVELALKKRGDSILFCAGSLYLIGAIKAHLAAKEKQYD